jgi:hypothetical protein
MRSIRESRRESVLGRTTEQRSAPPVPRRNEATRPDMESDEKSKATKNQANSARLDDQGGLTGGLI